jgi:REP-associated tyrosine transposase
MPYVRVWVHFNWSTKNRKRTIDHTLREHLLQHILENAKSKEIYIDTANCVEDHIHVLVSLGASQSLSKVVQLIKGESSHWVNINGLLKGQFEWQDDYFCVSVSDSAVGRVREYIRDQENHHKRKTYEEEYQEFMKEYGFSQENR